MTSQEVINAPIEGAQIDDLRSKLLICEESENDTFHFRGVKSHGWTFYDPTNNERDKITPGGRYGAFPEY